MDSSSSSVICSQQYSNDKQADKNIRHVKRGNELLEHGPYETLGHTQTCGKLSGWSLTVIRHAEKTKN